MGGKKDAVDPWEKLGIRPTNIGQVPKILDITWSMDQKLTVCLVGETGIGKTPIVHQWCEKNGGFMYPLNFGHMSQEEVSMIMFSDDATSFGFIPPDFLLELNRQAAEKGLAVLFLDEWNRGDKALVNALFTLTDERRIHNFKLHDNVLVVAAMNPSDGSYLVNEAEKDHAIRKRLNFIFTTHDLKAWLAYAKTQDWYPMVPAFIKASPSFLYDQGARDAGRAFPCPSNWEKVSNICKAALSRGTKITDPALKTMVEGQIGSIAGTKFLTYAENQNTLINPEEILKDYAVGSEVRKRVANLLNCKINSRTGAFEEKKDKGAARTSIISELNKGVALELFSNLPDPKKVAQGLGTYMGDLPIELLGPFVAQYMSEEQEKAGDKGSQYLNKLSDELNHVAVYRRRLKEIMDAKREYKNKLRKERSEDVMREY